MTRFSAAELARRLGQHQPTPEQAQVIEAPLEPAAVIAGAGAGKTETMAARVVWLIANRLVEPDQVLGLTFTRKAAAELGLRIRKRLAQLRRAIEHHDPELNALLQGQEPTVLTYAAYAGRLVSEQALRVGQEPDARLLSPAVAWQLADRVVREWPDPLLTFRVISSPVVWTLALSGQLADHLVTPQRVREDGHAAWDHFFSLPLGPRVRSDVPTGARTYVEALEARQELVDLVERFGELKREIGVVDFGDQMRVAAELAALPDVAAAERDRYRAVLLDEYQDTGHAQIEMLRGLYGDAHPVTAVGDPFQSIYGWRGASSVNMSAFARTFRRTDGTDATVYPLATSWRNDEAILTVANEVSASLRASNPDLVELKARPDAGPGLVEAAFHERVDDEATWVAARIKHAWDGLEPGSRTAAVLVRRRSQMPILYDALIAAGLEAEIVGLGGLLTTPEVVDVVATLRVLGDYKPSGALARLLTGPRWRIGPRDLAALRSRASYLVRPLEGASGSDSEPLSLVEALDDLGPANRFSPDGYARLSRLAGELRRLRRRLGAPLAELVAEVESTIGVGIEVQARPDHARVGRVHLDRFLDVTAEFASEGSSRPDNGRGAGDNSLRAFLAYLEAAEDEENGLEAGDVVVEAERVQLLTVHGAKGLEWEIVSVPGLGSDLFPASPTAINWTTARQQLPGHLRGDRDAMPPLDLAAADSRKDIADRLAAYADALKVRHAAEERRLAYVALTRAKTHLFTSGYAWDTTKKPRTPSPFLSDVRLHMGAEIWFEPEPDAVNPRTVEEETAVWPIDPLAPVPGAHGDRRAVVGAGAALVRAAASAALVLPVTEREAEWRRDVETLLAERAARRRDEIIEVELPAQLSVSQLVELERDPEQLARRLHRPVPTEPAPWARRGTAFHTWLEQRWVDDLPLLDIDELPGSADESLREAADDAELATLQAAFEASQWADRRPAEVEVPFEMAVGATVVRGRMDAVFGSAQDGWLVVDWKTGSRPTGAAARAAAIQLAAYRLAWAELNGIPDGAIHTVRAAFHYVRSNDTVEPANLLTAAELRELITGDATRNDAG